jgi:hypothetical protein
MIKWCGKLLLGGLLLLMFGNWTCSDQQSGEFAWLKTLPKPWKLSEEELTVLLPEFRTHFPDFNQRLKALALWRVGTPYEIFKLGEEVEPDPDPIFRLDVSDCTGHVLTCLSLAQSDTWQEARENMITIHYKPDQSGRKTPTYLSRWHYTTDRITANPYTVDITRSLLAESDLKAITLTLNHKEGGGEFLDLDWSRELTAYYIPNEKINTDLLANLPELCGVAFVRPSYFKMGIIVGHEGMIIDRKYLIHASQSEGKTVKVDFLDYYFPDSGPFFDGIMLYRFNPLEQ